MQIQFIPQVNNDQYLLYEITGNKIVAKVYTLNQETYVYDFNHEEVIDFTEFPDGKLAEPIRDDKDIALVLSATKIDGNLSVELLRWMPREVTKQHPEMLNPTPFDSVGFTDSLPELTKPPVAQESIYNYTYDKELTDIQKEVLSNIPTTDGQAMNPKVLEVIKGFLETGVLDEESLEKEIGTITPL